MNNKNDSLININLTNLDELYVVTKQFAGKKYFLRKKRGGGYKCDQKFAKGCKIFDDYNEALEQATRINAHKQKVKLKVETASTYFCNKLMYRFNRYSWNTAFQIYNEMIPIEKFQNELKGAKKYSLEQKDQFIEHYKKELEKEIQSEKSIRQDYTNDIKQARRRLKTRLSMKEDNLIKYRKAIDKVKQFKYDNFVAQVETEQDKKYKILYGEIEL